MKEVKIGLIGANWMGSYHSIGLTSVRQAYQDILPVFESVADVNEAAAKTAATRFGYKKVFTDWHDVINDPEVELVIIATPNFTHAEIAIAAAKAGKHILCEKPMANKLEDGKAMADAVAQAGIKSLVDFIYTKCPANVQAQKMVQNGQIGNFVTFRAEFDISACSDPTTPATWRQMAATAGTGALGDLTAHLISLSDMVVGKKIVSVMASMDTPYVVRPDARDNTKTVEVDTDDQIYVIVKYEDGRIGSMSSSRISSARPYGLTYEIQGDKGSIRYDITHLNELEYCNIDCDISERGFKTIKGNVNHGDYSKFCASYELGISYGDVMAIQAHHILEAIVEDKDVEIDIAYGHSVDTVLAAMAKSAKENRWVDIAEVAL